MKRTAPAKFESEAAMCARFLAALPDGWVSFNETAGWDILLVRKADGFQIGIQAKLRLNFDVMRQAMDHWHRYTQHKAGPDCRAVMVPCGVPSGAVGIAGSLGLSVILVAAEGKAVFTPKLPGTGESRWGDPVWHEWCPDRRHDLPEYVPDVPAGVPSPQLLNDWKIGALKIAVILDQLGYVTSKEFSAIGISPSRWMQHWLVPAGKTPPPKSLQRYVTGARTPDFKSQHPTIYEQIKADKDKWWPPGTPRTADEAVQEAKQMQLV